MKKSSIQPYWWDWLAIALLFFLLQVFASRLVTTAWTPNLYFIQTFTYMGIVLGLALGYSRFKRSSSRWLSLGYMLFMLPVIWTRVLDQQVALDERLLSVGGRLLVSFQEFFARQPVDDPLFFVAIMSVVFWVVSVSSGFSLTRHQNFLAAVLPAAIGILFIQHYDNGAPGRIWILALFAFIALFLLGRLNFLQDQKDWRARRVFLSPENSLDLTSSMAIAAGLIIFISWTTPLSVTRIDTFRQVWSRLTKPWTEFTQRMENAVSALESTSGGSSSEFYGTELELGRGFPLSDVVMFSVEVPELPSDKKPPRYYWRGRTYDFFANDQWYITGTTRESYSPVDPNLPINSTEDANPVRFIFTTRSSKFSLLYAPSQPIWFSRPGSYLASPTDTTLNIVSWNATPALLPGETYQVDAILSNPNIQQLREAGTQYPQWVIDTYLQMPKNFSPRIQTLAEEITAEAETPYDKATAITRYLRQNITYEAIIPSPPRRADRLEWILFEYKKAYCVYYATSEVLMLRSIGIPARMAVGFAEGTGVNTEAVEGISQTNLSTTYTVQKNNAHAWPEVYFPDIGWIEFEPTGNQDPLDRPIAPRDPSEINNSSNNVNGPILEENNPDFAGREPLDEEGLTATTQPDNSITLRRYLILLFITGAALTIFLSRRYILPARAPVFIRTTMERTGIETPAWVYHWERWVSLSSIERSFESINFGLRRVKQPAPVHATPIERAHNLAIILPQLKTEIKVLLDEHQTSLYTSRVADEKLARRTAFHIRTQVVMSVVRHFLIGTYETPATRPKT